MEVNLFSLWLPIVLSALAVFIASSLIWMVVQYHNSDWSRLPDEDAAREALRGVPPGQYTVPYAMSGKERSDPEWQRKYAEGPAAMLTIMPAGPPNMARMLGAWIIYCLAVSVVVAYMAGATLEPGTGYRKVFQVTGTAAFLAYAGAAASGSIWFGHSWGRTIKDTIDGLVYAALTAGIFGWLWP